MVDIEPYEYQRKTNLKEHNDLVAKINEIVDVINNTNLDTVIPRISKLEQDITTINATDSLQWDDIENVKTSINTINPKITKLEQDVTNINSVDVVQNTNISNLKAKDSEHDTRLGTIDSEIAGISKSLVSDVAILNGTTTGNVKVRIERTNAPPIDSNDYNIQKPTSVELIQGSAPAMVKAQITLSDGTVLISDDFMFTTEAIGTDVYISSFIFKNGNVAGTISADIGLSNGSTLTANNFVVPTDPNVTSAISGLQGRVTTVENDVSGLKTTVNGHTTSINGLDSELSDLQTRMTAVEGGTIVGFNELKQTVEGHTASISALDSDVANLQIDKADTSTVETLTNTVNGKVNISQGTGNAGKVLGINASGNVEPTEISSGGEVWEEINFSSFPRNWVEGDRIKVQFSLKETYNGSINWTTAPTNNPSTVTDNRYISNFIEIELRSTSYDPKTPIMFYNSGTDYCVSLSIDRVTPPRFWNGDGDYGSTMIMSILTVLFNGAGMVNSTRTLDPSPGFINKMYRLKK